MALNVLGNGLILPGEDVLSGMLGNSVRLWDELRGYLRDLYNFTEEWKFQGKGQGWVLMLRFNPGTAVHLNPSYGYFTIRTLVKEGAVTAIQNSMLPPDIKTAILSVIPAKNGRPFIMEVRQDPDLETAKLLITILIAAQP